MMAGKILFLISSIRCRHSLVFIRAFAKTKRNKNMVSVPVKSQKKYDPTTNSRLVSKSVPMFLRIKSFPLIALIMANKHEAMNPKKIIHKRVFNMVIFCLLISGCSSVRFSLPPLGDLSGVELRFVNGAELRLLKLPAGVSGAMAIVPASFPFMAEEECVLVSVLVFATEDLRSMTLFKVPYTARKSRTQARMFTPAQVNQNTCNVVTCATHSVLL